MFSRYRTTMHTWSETRVSVASEPVERVHSVLRNFGHDQSFVCCVRRHPFAREENKQHGGGNMLRVIEVFASTKGPFAEPTLRDFSAGGAPIVREPPPRLPCPVPAPPPCFPSFPLRHRCSRVDLLGALHHLSILPCSPCGLVDLEQGFHHSHPAASNTSRSRWCPLLPGGSRFWFSLLAATSKQATAPR